MECVALSKDTFSETGKIPNTGKPKANGRVGSPREHYLKSIGFTPGIDPFVRPVAEQEMGLMENASRFFAYYSSPETAASEALSIEVLRRPQHSLVFGNPGAGKTSLRYALEASCRIQPNRTLAVTYVLSDNISQPLTPEEHEARLARTLAVDLVLQVIEQTSQQVHPRDWWTNERRVAALARQVRQGGQKLLRFLKAILDPQALQTRDPRQARLGLGIYWKQVARHPVQRVSLNEPLRQVLASVLRLVEQDADRPGGSTFAQGVEDANLWGFERVFVIVDGIDIRLRSQADMSALMFPLLARIPADTVRQVYYKFFVPLEIKPVIDAWCKQHLPPGLYSNCMNATIIWTQPALKKLLIQRFRASGSQMIMSLDELAGPDLEMGLEQTLIDMAKGSPRRLLKLVSDLIQAHIERNPDQVLISNADFQGMKSAARQLSHMG